MTREDIKKKLCNVEEIIRIDRANVKLLGITHAQIGDALKTLGRLAVHKSDIHFGGAMIHMMNKMLGKAPIVEPQFVTPFTVPDPQWCDQGRFESTFKFNGHNLRVFVILWGGSQSCPFQHTDNKCYHGYKYGARDVIVTNLDNGKQLCFSTLLPHMIKHHGWFEGHGCHYRLDPQRVFQVLGPFEPEKSYRVAHHKTDKWVETLSESAVADQETQETIIPLTGLDSIKELTVEQTTASIRLKHHTINIIGNKLQVRAMTNEDVSQDVHDQNLLKLGLDNDQLKKHWSYEFGKKSGVKTYHWSEWLPNIVDGSKSKDAANADGPRMIAIGKNK